MNRLPEGQNFTLTIDREYERKCIRPYCEGGTYIQGWSAHSNVMGQLFHHKKGDTCNICYGRGTVLSRLRGWVRIWLNGDTLWVINPTKNAFLKVPIISGTEMHTLLAEKVIAAYIDGKLSPGEYIGEFDETVIRRPPYEDTE